jgi:transcriptional regulator with XRE-family HTH domain
MEIKTLGGRLKQARERVGMTQSQLADVIGITQSRYHPWETGRQGKDIEPDVESLVKLSDILGVSIEWLIRGEGDYDHIRILLTEQESRLISKFRIAKQLDVALDIERLANLVIQDATAHYGGDFDERFHKGLQKGKKKLKKPEKKKSA